MIVEELSYDIFWYEDGVQKGVRVIDGINSSINMGEYAQMIVDQIKTRPNVTELTVWHRYNNTEDVTSEVVS